jgi:hypothetical protein
MGLQPLGRREAAFVLGVPIAWAVLLLFHPGGDGTQIYDDLAGDGTRMLVVHVGMLVFIPMFALAVALLLRGNATPAARLSRIALAVFVVFYAAWESLQGIANGILVDQVSALPATDTALGANLIQDFAESPLVRDLGILSTIGGTALIVGMIAAGSALRDAGAPRWTPWSLGLAGLLIIAHPPPFGPTGLAVFAITAFVVLRERVPAGARTVADERAAHPRAFSRAEQVGLLAVPAAWAILLLFHPTGEGEDFYPIIRDEVSAWLVVHIATLVFVPLMAGVVFLLLRGLDGRWAATSRIALVGFSVVYLAWEALIGIGNGVLIDQVNELGSAQQPAAATIVERFADSGVVATLELVGTGAWILALVTAGAALVREAGAPRAVLALFAISALPIAWHVTPFGQFGLALFIVAVVLVLRGRTASAAIAVPAMRPASA